MSTSMWRPIACPAASPRPGTTFNTPGGRPASTASSPIRSALSEVCSAGFKMTLLPAPNAGPSFQAAICVGKFHGITAPTTPTGSRMIIARFSGPVGAMRS